MREWEVTHRASSLGHVLDGSTHGPNSTQFSLCERAVVKGSSPAPIDDTTSELVVTLLGIFPLFDKFGGRSFFVTYI